MALSFLDSTTFIQNAELQSRITVALINYARQNTANADASIATLAKAVLRANATQLDGYVQQFTRLMVITNLAGLNPPYTTAAIADATLTTAVTAAFLLLD